MRDFKVKLLLNNKKGEEIKKEIDLPDFEFDPEETEYKIIDASFPVGFNVKDKSFEELEDIANTFNSYTTVEQQNSVWNETIFNDIYKVIDLANALKVENVVYEKGVTSIEEVISRLQDELDNNNLISIQVLLSDIRQKDVDLGLVVTDGALNYHSITDEFIEDLYKEVIESFLNQF